MRFEFARLMCIGIYQLFLVTEEWCTIFRVWLRKYVENISPLTFVTLIYIWSAFLWRKILMVFLFFPCRVVEFASYSDMKNAIEKLDDTEINGRRIRLVEDKPRSHSKRRCLSLLSVIKIIQFISRVYAIHWHWFWLDNNIEYNCHKYTPTDNLSLKVRFGLQMKMS